MYSRIGVNSKKHMNNINRSIRKHKMSNRNFYIYSYDGEKAYNIDEEDYYNDAIDNNKEEWDEYPELDDMDENNISEEDSSYDEDGYLWEKYDGNKEYYDTPEDNDDTDMEDLEYYDEDESMDYEITIDPKKALIASAGILVGVVAIACLFKRKR